MNNSLYNALFGALFVFFMTQISIYRDKKLCNFLTGIAIFETDVLNIIHNNF